jgi:hypothetical protein
MKLKVVVIDLEVSRRAKKIAAAIAIPVVILGAWAIAYASVPHAFTAGETLAASDLNDDFNSVDQRVAAPFFSWSLITAAASGVEALAVEGQKTITFAKAGVYRITLNAQTIHDGNTTSQITWYTGGTATRLDSFSLESPGKIMYIQGGATDTRQVESTVLFVSATASQTFTVYPGLLVTYSAGTYHEGRFGYAVEYLGPP